MSPVRAEGGGQRVTGSKGTGPPGQGILGFLSAGEVPWRAPVTVPEVPFNSCNKRGFVSLKDPPGCSERIHGVGWRDRVQMGLVTPPRVMGTGVVRSGIQGVFGKSEPTALPARAVGVTEQREASRPALGFLVQATGRLEGPFSVPGRRSWVPLLSA